MDEETAYHEAGHALVATLLGGRVISVTIAPDDDDGPRRFGDTQVAWRRSLSERELRERGVQVALGGPVAEMLYTGDPFHPGLVAEWAGDWQSAWELAASLMPDERKRLSYLEDLTRQLHRLLDAEPHWSALAALADNLLAHETLERDEVREIVGEWMG